MLAYQFHLFFFPPFLLFMHAVPPVSLLLPPPHLLSSCAQTLRPALKPQLTVGTSPSFFCQHSMAFSACQLSTVRHVTETCTGFGNETNVDLLYMCLSVCPYVTSFIPIAIHPRRPTCSLRRSFGSFNLSIRRVIPGHVAHPSLLHEPFSSPCCRF